MRRALALALFVGCAEELPVECATEMVASAARPLEAPPTGPAIVVLNRCRGGCALAPGADDARARRSALVPAPMVLPEFPGSDAAWNEIVDCVAERFAPFDVIVLEEAPATGSYFEHVVVDARAEDLGLPPSVAGVAPGACTLHDNAISFSFAARGSDRPEWLCVVAAHEIGHTFGLEHELLCSDPMTYLPECGEREFQRVDAPCGEASARACECGDGNYQNSYLSLLDALGPRRTRQNRRPRVAVLSPRGARVTPGFVVRIEASDDLGVRRVSARLGAALVYTASAAPFVFRAPSELPLGPVRLEVEAVDGEGARTVVGEELELVLGAPRPDGAVRDVDDGDRPEIIGLPPDAGAGDGGEARILAGEGGCATAPSGSLGVALVLAFLAWRRRRILLALALVGCEDPGALRSSTGILELSPEPGATLSLEPLVLGRDEARRGFVRAKNVGDAPLSLEEPRIVGADGLSVLAYPRRLEPGEERSIWVRFAPRYALEARATLEIDAPTRVERYPIQAVARAPCQLFLTPVRQAFGPYDERTVRVEAAGLSDCTITRVVISEDLFELVGAPSVPFVIPHGEGVELRVRERDRTLRAGAPVRTIFVFEADGSAAQARIEGGPPIWGCVEPSPDPRDLPTGPLVEERVDLKFPKEGPSATAQRITLTNRCEDEAPRLLSVAVGAGFENYRVEAPALPAVLAPNRPLGLWVRRGPSPLGGPDRAEIFLGTDDAAARFIVLRARGEPLGLPRLFVSPSMDFGAVPDRGCASRVREVVLYNLGDATARVERLLPPGSGYSILSVELGGVSLDPSLPFDVPGASSAALRVELIPEAGGPLGPIHDALGVVAGERTLSVALRAERAADGTASERFVLGAPAAADVLFVVDESRSAEGARARLRRAVPAWLGATRELDLRVGVVLADPEGGAPSRCVGFDTFLESSALGPAELARGLECLLSPPPPPPRRVAGIDATLAFFERYSTSFLRPGARLAVVTLSDDDDASRASPALAARLLSSLAGPDRADLVSAHDVSGVVPAACAERFVQRGERYQELSRLTGGGSHDVCADDLAPALEAIAAHTLRPIDVLPLSRAADAATITVTVDGVPLRADALEGYTFDRARNAVLMHGELRAGALVEVRYSPACQP